MRLSVSNTFPKWWNELKWRLIWWVCSVLIVSFLPFFCFDNTNLLSFFFSSHRAEVSMFKACYCRLRGRIPSAARWVLRIEVGPQKRESCNWVLHYISRHQAGGSLALLVGYCKMLRWLVWLSGHFCGWIPSAACRVLQRKIKASNWFFTMI